MIGYSFVASFISVAVVSASAVAKSDSQSPGSVPKMGDKHVIGATATVEEVRSDLLFKARVDTGATTSSLHVDEFVIEDEAERMEDNVGKTIRFRMKNQDGESEWLKSRIAEVSLNQNLCRRRAPLQSPADAAALRGEEEGVGHAQRPLAHEVSHAVGSQFPTWRFVVDVEGRRAKRKPEQTQSRISLKNSKSQISPRARKRTVVKRIAPNSADVCRGLGEHSLCN